MKLMNRTPTLVGLLVVCAFFGSAARAQDDKKPAPPEVKPATLIGPLSLGFRVGVMVGNPMQVTSAATADDDVSPPRITDVAAESMSGHVGVGPVVQIHLIRHVLLNAELLHSSVGYNVTTTVSDEATEDTDAVFVSEDFETIRAKFWDLVILPRYQFGSPGKPRFYATGGIAIRSLSKERQMLTTTDSEGEVETSDVPVDVAHTVIRGAVIGAGVQAQDDVGFKIELEFRYTRWFQRTFDTDFARSQRNQAQILVGLTF